MEDFEKKIDTIMKENEITRYSDYDRSPFRLIKPLLMSIKGIKTSPEAKQAINEAINIAYYGITSEDRNKILVFGDSLKNEEEDLSDYDYLNRVILNYYEFDIKNLYHLSIDEYADKTVYHQNLLIKNAVKLMEMKSQRDADMLEDIDKSNKGVSDSIAELGELNGY